MTILILIILLVLLGGVAMLIANFPWIAGWAKTAIYIVLGLIAVLLVLNSFVPETLDRVRSEPVPRLD